MRTCRRQRMPSVQIGALASITSEARQMLIEGTHPTRVAIVTTDLVTTVITSFAYTAVRPTRLFTDETEATNWLLNLRPKPTAETEAEQESEDASDHSG